MARLEREHFNFSLEFQDLILACILKRAEFNRYAAVIKPKYFAGSVSTMTARALFSYQPVFPCRSVVARIFIRKGLYGDHPLPF